MVSYRRVISTPDKAPVGVAPVFGDPLRQCLPTRLLWTPWTLFPAADDVDIAFEMVFNRGQVWSGLVNPLPRIAGEPAQAPAAEEPAAAEPAAEEPAADATAEGAQAATDSAANASADAAGSADADAGYGTGYDAIGASVENEAGAAAGNNGSTATTQ